MLKVPKLCTLFSNKDFFYRLLLHKWISDDESELEGITEFDAVFRIPCRNFSFQCLDRFYKYEFKSFRKVYPNNLLIHQQKMCRILWVVDGLDESNIEFNSFFKEVLKDMSENHKVIITSKPTTSNQLFGKKKMAEKVTCELTLEKFNEQQIKDVVQKYGIDLGNFEQYYKNLENGEKKVLKNPLNLSLILESWSPLNNITLKKDLTTHKLYEHAFEKWIKDLVEIHKGKTDLDDNDLELSVRKWFIQSFCKIASESLLNSHHTLMLNPSHIYELTDNAMNKQLIANCCISVFLDSEVSYGEVSYFFRHKTQREANASLFIKHYIDKEPEFICETVDNFPALNNFFAIFEFLDLDILLKLFALLLKHGTIHLHFSDLLKIKDRDWDLLKNLKDINVCSERKIDFYGICKPRELVQLVHMHLPELSNFNVCLNIDEINSVEWHDAINEYKDKVNLTLTDCFKISDTSDIRNMEKKVTEIHSHLCCDALFTIIMDGYSFVYLLNDAFTDIAKYFRTLTINYLDITLYGSFNVNVDSNLFCKFASSVKVKDLRLHLFRSYFKSYKDLLAQFLNVVKVERLNLYVEAIDENIFQEFLEKLDWKVQTNLQHIKVAINVEQLKLLYKHIPQEIAMKTEVNIFTPLQDLPQPDGKKFLRIKREDKAPLDYETYKTLKKLGTQVASYNFKELI